MKKNPYMYSRLGGKGEAGGEAVGESKGKGENEGKSEGDESTCLVRSEGEENRKVHKARTRQCDETLALV
eukprot:2997715-Pleurochrysis_carterae.AAC.5